GRWQLLSIGQPVGPAVFVCHQPRRPVPEILDQVSLEDVDWLVDMTVEIEPLTSHGSSSFLAGSSHRATAGVDDCVHLWDDRILQHGAEGNRDVRDGDPDRGRLQKTETPLDDLGAD